MTEEFPETGQFQIEQKESIKLMKMSKGNYNWEIKILSLDVDKIEAINKKLVEKFGEKA